MVLEGQKEAGHVLEEDLPGRKVVEVIAPTPAFEPEFPSFSPPSCTMLAINERIDFNLINTNIATNQFGLIDSI